MKLISAGVSKSTGKPYNAFYACEVRTHKQPRAGTSTPTPTPAIQTKENVNWDKISFGKCKHAFLVEAFKKFVETGITDKEYWEKEAEIWAKMSMRKLDEPR